MKIETEQLIQAEKYALSEFVKSWAKEYAVSVFKSKPDDAYAVLFVRMMATRFRKNGIIEFVNIKQVMDIFLFDDMSATASMRLSQIILDPAKDEEAKMSEILKQFRGVKASKEPGFKFWKRK